MEKISVNGARQPAPAQTPPLTCRELNARAKLLSALVNLATTVWEKKR